MSTKALTKLGVISPPVFRTFSLYTFYCEQLLRESAYASRRAWLHNFIQNKNLARGVSMYSFHNMRVISATCLLAGCICFAALWQARPWMSRVPKSPSCKLATSFSGLLDIYQDKQEASLQLLSVYKRLSKVYSTIIFTKILPLISSTTTYPKIYHLIPRGKLPKA